MKEAALPTDNLAEVTRVQIVAAARRLFTAKLNADTSINDFVNAAGVTRATLYHYFKAKAPLFAEVFAATVAQTYGSACVTAAKRRSTPAPSPRFSIKLIDGRSVLDAKRRRAILASIGTVEADMIRSAIELLIQSDELPPGIRVESAATLLTGVFDAASIAIAETEDKLKRRKEDRRYAHDAGDALTN